jgi:hypothetical protein
MRASNDLERLSAAAPAQLARTESLVDAGEEDRILEAIFASSRTAGLRASRLRPALAVAGLAVVAAVVAAAAGGVFTGSKAAVPQSRGHDGHVVLSGAKIQLAGYHFKTPAGFKASKSGCLSAPVAGAPQPAIDGFAAAAAADGACVQAADLAAGDWLEKHAPIPDSADPVDVGQYHGFYAAQASGGESTLYVDLPNADGQRVVYLVLVGRDVTEDQLVAIAASGLPTLPPSGPTATTGTEGGG